MNLKQMGSWGQSRSTTSDDSVLPAAERCLTLLADGAAAGMPEFDADCYRGFRAKLDGLGRQLRDRLPDADKLALIGTILREFESYRNDSETALREQLAAWRNAAPFGRLVVLESVWGEVDRAEVLKGKARAALRRLRGTPDDHHGEYRPEVRGALPLGTGTPPSQVIEMVIDAGWRTPRLERLRDIEWATAVSLALPERLLGVPPRFAVLAT